MIDPTVAVATRIEAAASKIPGWTPTDQLLALFTLAHTTIDVPGDLLEIGSWCGRSAVALGMAARCSGRGRLHCIDLFPGRDDWHRNADGTYSMEVTIGGKIHRAYVEQTVWAEPFHRDITPVYDEFPGVLEAFEAAILANGLESNVTAFRGDFSSFVNTVPGNFALRFAFIDGDHSYRAVASDIAMVERFLSPGGWLCFDDAFSSYDGVDDAIRRHVIGSGRYDCCQQLTRKLFAARRGRAG